MNRIFSSILLLFSSLGTFAYGQSNTSLLADTLQREVSVVSDKNVSIEPSSALPFRYLISAPEIKTKALEDTRFLTPPLLRLDSSDTPFMSDRASRIPQPNSSFYARLSASYYQPSINFSSGIWANLQDRGLLRFHIDYQALQNVSQGETSSALLVGGKQREYPAFRQQLKSRLVYEKDLETCSFLMGGDFEIFHNDFYSLFTLPSLTMVPEEAEALSNIFYAPRLYAGIRDLSLSLFDFSLIGDYRLSFQDAFKPYNLEDYKRMQHSVTMQGQFNGEISHLWEWALPFLLRSHIYTTITPLELQESSFRQFHKHYTTLQTTPMATFSREWDAWAFSMEGGVGLDFDFTRAGELVLFPHLRTQLTWNRNWQLYLTSTGGIRNEPLLQLYHMMPYADPTLLPMPEHSPFDITAGIRGNIADLVGIDLYAGTQRTLNSHYWTRSVEELAPHKNAFYSLFSMANLPRFQENKVGSILSYKWKQSFSTQIHGLYRTTHTSSDLPSVRPQWEVDLNATYSPSESWLLSASSFLKLQQEYLEKASPSEPTKNSFNQYGITGLVQWNPHKRYSLFARYRWEQNTLPGMLWAMPHTIQIGGQLNF